MAFSPIPPFMFTFTFRCQAHKVPFCAEPAREQDVCDYEESCNYPSKRVAKQPFMHKRQMRVSNFSVSASLYDQASEAFVSAVCSDQSSGMINDLQAELEVERRSAFGAVAARRKLEEATSDPLGAFERSRAAERQAREEYRKISEIARERAESQLQSVQAGLAAVKEDLQKARATPVQAPKTQQAAEARHQATVRQLKTQLDIATVEVLRSKTLGTKQQKTIWELERDLASATAKIPEHQQQAPSRDVAMPDVKKADVSGGPLPEELVAELDRLRARNTELESERAAQEEKFRVQGAEIERLRPNDAERPDPEQQSQGVDLLIDSQHAESPSATDGVDGPASEHHAAEIKQQASDEQVRSGGGPPSSNTRSRVRAQHQDMRDLRSSNGRRARPVDSHRPSGGLVKRSQPDPIMTRVRASNMANAVLRSEAKNPGPIQCNKSFAELEHDFLAHEWRVEQATIDEEEKKAKALETRLREMSDDIQKRNRINQRKFNKFKAMEEAEKAGKDKVLEDVTSGMSKLDTNKKTRAQIEADEEYGDDEDDES